MPDCDIKHYQGEVIQESQRVPGSRTIGKMRGLLENAVCTYRSEHGYSGPGTLSAGESGQ